jgi:hypothetical protein
VRGRVGEAGEDVVRPEGLDVREAEGREVLGKRGEVWRRRGKAQGTQVAGKVTEFLYLVSDGRVPVEETGSKLTR